MRPTPLSLLSALLCLAAALPPRSSATPVPTGGFEMRCENGRITVTSNEAPVEQLLSEFSRKSGVTFNKFAGKSATATLDLRDAAYEEFLSRLLGSYMAKSRKIDGQMVVSEVTVMDEGTGSAPPPVSGGDPSVGQERQEETRAREEALQRRRRRRRRPPRRPAQDAEAPAAQPENQPPPPAAPPDQPPDAEPPPEAPPPDEEPPPEGDPPPMA